MTRKAEFMGAIGRYTLCTSGTKICAWQDAPEQVRAEEALRCRIFAAAVS
jgi:hypothetical protein